MRATEWNSGSYHRLSDHQFAWGLKVLARAENLIHGNETVMDAGCGTGRVTFELLRCLPRGRVVAVDLSRNMLLGAGESLRTRYDAHVRFVRADLQRLPFQAAFDGIFSTAAFHWVPDHRRLFCELYAALKPGGWLVAQCGGGPNLKRLREIAADVIAEKPFSRFFQGWSEPWEFAAPAATVQRLRRAGFVDAEAWLESAAFSLPDFETYREYFATVTLHQHAEQITDPELRERFLNEVARRAINEPGFKLDYWRLNIQAEKA
jgi:trans-aconitate methyltransferase